MDHVNYIRNITNTFNVSQMANNTHHHNDFFQQHVKLSGRAASHTEYHTQDRRDRQYKLLTLTVSG